ncbi:hypothetical protein [Nocardia sp. A7]|uniref:hypothetical protein n=1 Tax=Nocardia sp. A7 TaxID=2789274 RepID=UPI003978F737
MDMQNLVDAVDLGIGQRVDRPDNMYSLRGYLRAAYGQTGTTMTDVADRTGLSRTAVAAVLGYESNQFPDHDDFMAIVRDLVDKTTWAAWSDSWQAAYDSPNRMVHPPVTRIEDRV